MSGIETKNYKAGDIIYSINDAVESLSKKIDLIDLNIKSLNNKFIILTKKIDKLEAQQAKPIAKDGNSSSSKSSKLVLGSVKTYGYIVNKSREPIVGVFVKIFNSRDEEIRSINTDKNGYWEARLPSGKYLVRYEHKNFKDIEKIVDIEKGIKEVEVY